jgi:ferrous iron transport protein A
LDGLIPLHRLVAGQSAHIRRIVGRADDVHRLAEFGLRHGIQIQMFRPGDPCIIRLAATKVCLRAEQMLSVLVQPIDGCSAVPV